MIMQDRLIQLAKVSTNYFCAAVIGATLALLAVIAVDLAVRLVLA